MTDEQIESKAHSVYPEQLLGPKKRTAFYNGAKWMQSMSPRWVKASEQLPDEEGWFIVRWQPMFGGKRVRNTSKETMIEMLNHETDLAVEWLYEPPKTDNYGK